MADVLDMIGLRPPRSGAQAGWALREWDSSFFGVSIAQVATRHPTAGDLAAIAAEADHASIDCLYLLIDAGSAPGVCAAEASGFSLVDVRLTLEWRAQPDPRDALPGSAPAASGRVAPASAAILREARFDDVPRLEALARESHRNTRFHRDPRFDPARSDELYATWLRRSVARELADVVWVADVDDAPRGYLTIKADATGSTIGLVAVDPSYRGRGYGDALIRAARRWTADRALPRMMVVTQGSSAAAVRFYERAGFTASSVELWYHRWRTSPSGESRAAAR